jgi:type IV pilus assembly protein PilC
MVSGMLPGFSRKLAAMLSAGLPIVASLNALERQARQPPFRSLIAQIRKGIENGAALSESLKRFPSVFDELYTNLVRAGESGGHLAETMARLASLLEASARLRRKVRGAMVYPIVVLCVALAITTGMILFIVPVFADMFASFRQALPAPTLFLLKLSHFLRQFLPLVVAAAVAGVVVFRKWKQTPAGAYAMDRFILKLPVFGDLTRKVASARFARTFGQLIHSGVPILSALDIASGATGNKVAARVVLDSMAVVERGDPLSSALANQPVFDPMLVDMLQAGEKTGKIDEMMTFTADYFDDEVNTTLDNLTALLEPVLMMLLGAVIGGIVVCMFLPLFKLPAMIG